MTKVTVTAGHGAQDCGVVAKDGTTESSIATEMRRIVKFYLDREGINVVTDGVGDKNLPLRDAVKLIKGSKVAIELHCNGSNDATSNGIEVISQPKHKGLAQDIAGAIKEVTGSRLRGDKGWQPESVSPHHRLAYVRNGGLIVELFFISNPKELATYREKKWLIGKAIAKVLADYCVKA